MCVCVRARKGTHRHAHTTTRFVSINLTQTNLLFLFRIVQFAFKVLMIHWILQFTLIIAFRCVLHRYESQEIHREKLIFCFCFLFVFFFFKGYFAKKHRLMCFRRKSFFWYYFSKKKRNKLKLQEHKVWFFFEIKRKGDARGVPIPLGGCFFFVLMILPQVHLR